MCHLDQPPPKSAPAFALDALLERARPARAAFDNTHIVQDTELGGIVSMQVAVMDGIGRK